MKKINVWETTDKKVFKNYAEGSDHQSKLDIISMLNTLENINIDNDLLDIQDLDTFTLETLRRIGRAANDILKD